MVTLSDISATLTPSFITPFEEASLLTHICSHLSTLPTRSHQRSRIARFGWNYRGHQRTEPIPWWCVGLLARLPVQRPLDSLTLNEYLPERAIESHVDPLEFGDPILILGLESACAFELSLNDQRINFHFPPRALLSLSGPSRFPWHHAVAPVKVLRYSLVFRWLKEPMNANAISSPRQ